jgi:lipopolysaccharide/colanic/teichoic acid biosynthesis glycosyltransferase
MGDQFKRGFDVALAAVGLVALLPVGVVIAIVIKLDSRGPVYYRGKRTGRWNVPFFIYKFRTMRPNAEHLGTTTSMHDSRITRVGGALRRLKLDELPQLINVVMGDMSLVGPRPEVEEHTNAYSEEEQEILSVRPGITDYSSLRFINLGDELGEHRAHEVFVSRIRPQKNALRLRYVRERSFHGDLAILAKTVLALIGQGLKWIGRS